MEAKALFSNGGFRVRDGEKTVGFVWVEPAPNDGQIQRWLLTSVLDPTSGGSASFLFERWGKDMTLEDWKTAVRKQVPHDQPNDAWGSDPTRDGLWPRATAKYIVAQSSVVRPRVANKALFFPQMEPAYPRRDAVAAINARLPVAEDPRRPAAEAQAASAAGTGSAAPPGPPEKTYGGSGDGGQIVIPLIEHRQWPSASQPSAEIVGMSSGTVYTSGGETYYEGEEVFLLMPTYRSIGSIDLASRWEKPETTLPQAGSHTQAQTYIQQQWTEGCRYEVTGCNYYQGEEPPAIEFL